MIMVGLVGAGMGVVVVKNAGPNHGVGPMSGDAGASPECEVMTPDHTAIQVCSYG